MLDKGKNITFNLSKILWPPMDDLFHSVECYNFLGCTREIGEEGDGSPIRGQKLGRITKLWKFLNYIFKQDWIFKASFVSLY